MTLAVTSTNGNGAAPAAYFDAPPVRPTMPAFMPVQAMQELAKLMAEAKGLGVKSPAHGLAVIMRAEAEGVHYCNILDRYDYIEKFDRLAKKSTTLLTDFQRGGGRVQIIQSSPTIVEALFHHPTLIEPLPVRFTIEDAQRAGLANKDLWKQYPEDMLFARVITRGVRRVLPGVFSGSYSAEEYADIDATNTSTTTTTTTPAQPQETPSGIPLPPAKPLKPEAPPNISRPTLAQMVAEAIKASKLPVEKPTLFKELKTEVVRRGLREVGAVITGDDLVKLWDDEANAEWMRAVVVGYITEINAPAAQGE